MTTVDLSVNLVDFDMFDFTGQVVQGGFTLGKTTAIGSGEFTTTDGFACNFLLSVHRWSPTAEGRGRLHIYCTAHGEYIAVIPVQFRAQWSGSSLTGTVAAGAIYVAVGGGQIFWDPAADMRLTVNIGS